MKVSEEILAPPAPPGDARRRYRAVGTGLAASDGLCLVAALLVSYAVRFGLEPMPADFAAVTVVTPLVWLAVFHGFKLYAPWRLSPPEEFRRVIGACSVGIVLVVLASYWSHSSFSRAWVGLTWLFVVVFELSVRRLWRWYVGRLKVDGRLALRTLIVGGGVEAAELVRALEEPGSGFHPVARVGEDDAGTALPRTGGLDGVAPAVTAHGADSVFIASSSLTTDEVSLAAKAARRAGAEVWVSAKLPEILTTRVTAQPMGAVTALSLGPIQLTTTQLLLKRIFDVIVATVILVVTLPVWLAAAIAIRASSRGPILYRQERVGRRGRPFTMLKLRTMRIDAEARRGELAARNEAGGPLFKMRRDPRVTRVGRWLRRWSIDELPQLLNVLRGEMSLVGPRPPLAEEVARYHDWHHERFEVPPGITGLWQVSGRSNLSFEDYVRLDLFYIENWSLAYDLFIVAKTIPVVLRGTGSY